MGKKTRGKDRKLCIIISETIWRPSDHLVHMDCNLDWVVD